LTYLGATSIEVRPTQRPFTHSLAVVAVLLFAAALWRREAVVLLGASAGLVMHLIRDVAEGPPGVALLWSVNDQVWVAGRVTFLILVTGLLIARLLLLCSVRLHWHRVRAMLGKASCRST
jgi:membrane-bound metal-dependent hydrolase YbcI (DUF457 family)